MNRTALIILLFAAAGVGLLLWMRKRAQATKSAPQPVPPAPTRQVMTISELKSRAVASGGEGAVLRASSSVLGDSLFTLRQSGLSAA